ncbi:MAG TPA: hypothetical protein VLG69_00015 [Candidatus Andersenbacteria bacterium]|nr:hypothetical protein [Candidatus Andersenbacteria bacterium]
MAAHREKTPRLLTITRVLFALYFIYYILDWHFGWLLGSRLSIIWLGYLVLIYAISERIYASFKKRGVDLVYAFPILFIASQLDFASIILRSQENIPIINRFEHFSMYILLSYVVSQFFLRYLPQKVWNDHPYYTAILILSVTQCLGVINEILELYMDTNFHTNAIGPRFDTNLDLLMNMLGAGLFLCIRLILHEANKSNILKVEF